MTLPPAVAYLSGLAFVAPDLPPPALFGAARAHHLEVAPAHALRPAGPQRLHGGLLGREARRVAREAAAAAGLAVRLLRRGEDARLEARAGPSLERAADARHVAHVDAQADDHRGPSVLSARRLVTRPPSREPRRASAATTDEAEVFLRRRREERARPPQAPDRPSQ